MIVLWEQMYVIGCLAESQHVQGQQDSPLTGSRMKCRTAQNVMHER